MSKNEKMRIARRIRMALRDAGYGSDMVRVFRRPYSIECRIRTPELTAAQVRAVAGRWAAVDVSFSDAAARQLVGRPGPVQTIQAAATLAGLTAGLYYGSRAAVPALSSLASRLPLGSLLSLGQRGYQAGSSLMRRVRSAQVAS